MHRQAPRTSSAHLGLSSAGGGRLIWREACGEVQAVSADVAQGGAVIARSLLFVPGDSDRKLAKIEGCGADIIVLDLEDSVAPGQKADARQRVHQYLSAHLDRKSSALWVRINPLDTPDALSDLAAVAGAVPDGIVQPKT